MENVGKEQLELIMISKLTGKRYGNMWKLANTVYILSNFTTAFSHVLLRNICE